MSTIQLSLYVNFQGHAREALEFYHRVLGGTLDLQTVNAEGVAQPAGPGDRLTHAQLDAAGARIIAVDGHPSYPAQLGDAMALALGGTDKERLTQIFHALAEGGKIKMPPTAQHGGPAVGWLTDQFGVNWMVQIDPA